MPANTRYTGAKSRPTYTFDANLEFKDAGLVAADAAAQVDGSNQIIDVGAAKFKGDMVIDVTAIEVASGDEKYDIQVQGSTSSTFASGNEQLASLALGDSSVVGGDADSATGRFVLPFNNLAENGTPYRYLRLYTDVTGTIATGINYTGWASPIQK